MYNNTVGLYQIVPCNICKCQKMKKKRSSRRQDGESGEYKVVGEFVVNKVLGRKQLIQNEKLTVAVNCC